MCDLRIQTQVLTLEWQVLHQLCYLLSMLSLYLMIRGKKLTPPTKVLSPFSWHVRLILNFGDLNVNLRIQTHSCLVLFEWGSFYVGQGSLLPSASWVLELWCKPLCSASHAHLFMDCQLLSESVCRTEQTCPTKPKALTIWTFTKKAQHPWFRGKKSWVC